MPQESRQHEFQIQRSQVRWYLCLSSTLLVFVCTVFLFGLGILLAPLWFVTFGLWISGRQAEVLRYWLDGSTLRINEGFIFVKQKSIPLDRVTDVVLAQGPVQRALGIWQMSIQTAGMGQQMAEGILLGVVEPQAARDLLLARRDETTGANRSGA